MIFADERVAWIDRLISERIGAGAVRPGVLMGEAVWWQRQLTPDATFTCKVPIADVQTKLPEEVADQVVKHMRQREAAVEVALLRSRLPHVDKRKAS